MSTKLIGVFFSVAHRCVLGPGRSGRWRLCVATAAVASTFAVVAAGAQAGSPSAHSFAAASGVGFKALAKNPAPAMLGSFGIKKFAPDSRSDGTDVTSVTGPSGGTVQFHHSVSKETVPESWGSWSNGYTGSVYYSSIETLTLTLPSDTKAFYLYVEPNDFQSFTVTATANHGAATSGPHFVYGKGGAKGFAFYAKTKAAHVTRIRLTCNDGAGFAVGEFGIHG